MKTKIILLLLIASFAMGQSNAKTRQPVALQKVYISTKEEFLKIKDDPSLHYILTKDIDFENQEIQPFEIFSGAFDGEGHTIKNFRIKGDGLFSTLQNAMIVNLKIENANINGANNSTVGGLTRNSYYSKIINVAFFGTVVGLGETGGLVGDNNGPIISSYFVGNVTSSSSYVGGLVGFNSGKITSSYSIADVRGTEYVGGLVGSNAGNITSSFSLSKSIVAKKHGGTFAGQTSREWNIQKSYSLPIPNMDFVECIYPCKLFIPQDNTNILKKGVLPDGFDAKFWAIDGNSYPMLKSMDIATQKKAQEWIL